jgi:RNA polymerase sigma factor (sigma-70 family)
MAADAGTDAADDMELLSRWREGDEIAGNQLFKRHMKSVYCFFDGKADGELDELVQETFLGCLHSRDRFRGLSSFRTYLFAIARNTLYGYWRRRCARGSTIDFEEVCLASLSTSVCTRLARRQDEKRVLTALRELPAAQQILLELHYWEGLDAKQLAEVFGIQHVTARTRLNRARQALKVKLRRKA